MSRGPTRRADSYFRALRYSAGRFATPGGPRSTPSGARRYSGGRSEPRSDPVGVRAPKPRSPPVSESRPGPASRAESPAFQVPRKPVRAARRKPRPTVACVRKRAAGGLGPAWKANDDGPPPARPGDFSPFPIRRRRFERGAQVSEARSPAL
jgi:hypothetical protein